MVNEDERWGSEEHKKRKGALESRIAHTSAGSDWLRRVQRIGKDSPISHTPQRRLRQQEISEDDLDE